MYLLLHTQTGDCVSIDSQYDLLMVDKGWICHHLDAAVNVGQVCCHTLCANNVIEAQLPDKA